MNKIKLLAASKRYYGEHQRKEPMLLPALMSLWLAQPIVPLNPLEQDTLPAMSVHVQTGFGAPNGIVKLGPRVAGLWEYRFHHPYLVRGGVEYRYNPTSTKLHLGNPLSVYRVRGDLHGIALTGDLLYYRGTRRLTGYLGFGLVYAMSSFTEDRAGSESLEARGINEIDISPKLGYRLMLGLRVKANYSLEIGVSETRPDFIYKLSPAPGIERISKEETRTGSFYVLFGYTFPYRER